MTPDLFYELFSVSLLLLVANTPGVTMTTPGVPHPTLVQGDRASTPPRPNDKTLLVHLLQVPDSESTKYFGRVRRPSRATATGLTSGYSEKTGVSKEPVGSTTLPGSGPGRQGRGARNYHELFEHFDKRGNPIGLNIGNFIESGGCNMLPPTWRKRVSGARVCTGCIRLYQGKDCTGRRSSDLASRNGCTFFQLSHFNDQAASVGACD